MHGHDQKTIDEAFYQFGKYLKDKTAVAPDLLSPALSLVTFNGGKKEYNELLELWKSAREFSELVSNLLLLR